MPTLADALAAVQNAVLSRLGRNDATVSFAFELGTPITAEALAGPGSADPAPGRAVELLSRLANTVPDLSNGAFRRTGRTVNGQYELLLQEARATAANDLDVLNNIKAAALASFDDLLGSLDGPGSFHPVIATPTAWYGPSEGWSHMHLESEQAADPGRVRRIDPALTQWRIASRVMAPPGGGGTITFPVDPTPPPPPTFEPIATTTANFTRDVIEASYNGPVILQPYEDWYRSIEAASARMLQDCLRQAQSAARWVLIDLSLNPVPAVSTAMKSADAFLVFMNGRLVTQFDFRMGKDQMQALVDGLAPRFVPTGVDRMTIDFDMSVVLIDRPWLSEVFLGSRVWYCPGVRQGEYSSGRDAAGGGNLNGIPIACVLARDLGIVAQWTTSDQAAMDDTAHLGPFSLAGHTFEGHSGTIDVKGMQAIGWVCALVPQVPPLDDPRLSGGGGLPAPPAALPPTSPAGADDLLSRLKAAGVDFSVPEAAARDWLGDPADTPYPALAQALLVRLGGRRLVAPVDLDKVAWCYQQASGREAPFEAAHIEADLLERAVVAASDDHNGGHATNFDALLGPPAPA